MWIVTQYAQFVGETPPLPAVAQAPIWGMGRVIALEYPEIWGGMIDLDDETAEQNAANLLTAIRESHGEDHIALRNDQHYVARLMRQPYSVTEPIRFQAKGTYLVTGGLGFLGLALARWMAVQGAGHLVLTGRREFPDRDAWTDLPEQSEFLRTIAAIQDIEAQGAAVTILQADVTDRERMQQVFDQIAATSFPLRGIIHAAGVFGYQALQDMTIDDMLPVFRPKMIGAWNLHQLSQTLDLDLFIEFSSLSVWGTRQQGHYAAANQFLDTLTHYRHSLGLAALTINWGLFPEASMVGQERHNWLEKIGIHEMPPKQSFEALAHLLATGSVQSIVANIDWNTFTDIYQARRPSPLLKEIINRASTIAAQQTEEVDNVLRQLQSSSANQRQKLLITYMQNQVAGALGLSAVQLDIRQPLNTIGLDSLMAVELRNRIKTDLEVEVPMVRFMEDASVEDLATLALDSLDAAQPTQLASSDASAANDAKTQKRTEPETVDKKRLIEGEI
jgi:NAD(P)-dependent dehydrogenase (short-subunit alcohol dehydrogenase family)/acyl carrier protein